MDVNPELSSASVLGLGFILGLRHATEADHLAAVSTIVSEKKDLLTASIVGAFWGIGHTISLFVLGLAVIILKLHIPETLENKLEAIVGVMLVLLGINALRKLAAADEVHVHTHQHGSREHIHIHTHDHEADRSSHHRFSRRSVLIGIVHGLAGSAGLMLLIVPTIGSTVVALAYILIFGLGSIAGMMLMSLLIGLPFHFTIARWNVLNRGVRVLAGGFSLLLGCSIIYERLLGTTL